MERRKLRKMAKEATNLKEEDQTRGLPSPVTITNTRAFGGLDQLQFRAQNELRIEKRERYSYKPCRCPPHYTRLCSGHRFLHLDRPPYNSRTPPIILHFMTFLYHMDHYEIIADTKADLALLFQTRVLQILD